MVTFPEHMSSSRFLGGGGRIIRFLFPCVCFVDRCLSFFFLAIVLSVLLRFMDSNYPIGIFKLILQRCTVYMKSYARTCAQYS